MMHATDKNFAELVTEAAVPALVMFYAPWAGPCNLVRPVFESAASRLGNQINFVDFNLDDNPLTPSKYGVRGIPLFMLFDKGKIKSIKVGNISEEVLLSMLTEEEALQ